MSYHDLHLLSTKPYSKRVYGLGLGRRSRPSAMTRIPGKSLSPQYPKLLHGPLNFFPLKKNPFVLEEKNMSGHFQISSSFENSDMPNTNFQTATMRSIPWGFAYHYFCKKNVWESNREVGIWSYIYHCNSSLKIRATWPFIQKKASHSKSEVKCRALPNWDLSFFYGLKLIPFCTRLSALILSDLPSFVVVDWKWIFTLEWKFFL